MKVKSESEVAQSCLNLSDPMDCSPPGSSVHGTREPEWGAIAFSSEDAHQQNFFKNKPWHSPVMGVAGGIWDYRAVS